MTKKMFWTIGLVRLTTTDDCWKKQGQNHRISVVALKPHLCCISIQHCFLARVDVSTQDLNIDISMLLCCYVAMLLFSYLATLVSVHSCFTYTYCYMMVANVT